MGFVAVLVAGVVAGLALAALMRALSSRATRFDESQDWHDNANVVDVHEYAPPGFSTCIAWGTRVSGISYHESAAESFVLGTAQQLDLMREPSNPFDRKAISVLGTWTDADGKRHRREMLGHLPRVVAAMVAELGPDAEIAAALRVMFIPMGGKGAGLRLNVWSKNKVVRPSRRRAENT
jgi:hypothetical protein